MIENTKKLEMSYDEVPYISKTFYNTQPNKLKSNLKLLNFETPDTETARVLEIGCSFGGNIIPFALANPKSKVIGLDLSKVQVDEGNKLIDSLGADNIKLYQKNIVDYKGEFGEFDYIICHGVYSWVPEDVQNAILDVIKKSLSKNGVAVISYNVYPGWKNMEIAKDIMTFRDKYLSKKGVEVTNENRVSFGKGAIEFILNHSQQNDRVKKSIKEILNKNDYYILHEYFELYNKPLYIYNFAEKLKEYELVHVVDSQFMKSFPLLDEEVEKKINNECGEDYIAKEQYYDYINDKKYDIIGIDEVQFFDDKIVEVINKLADDGVRVIVAGLDMDFKAEPFHPMPEIMAISEMVTKLHAVCNKCGKEASRSQRLINGEPAKYDDPIVVIGASESYEARCRHCHEIKR